MRNGKGMGAPDASSSWSVWLSLFGLPGLLIPLRRYDDAPLQHALLTAFDCLVRMTTSTKGDLDVLFGSARLAG
jgi:hypothetical protein